MDSEIVKVNDAKVQSLGLKFSFSTEGDKLIIEAFCSKDNQKYVGEIIANPYVDLQDIKELLNEGQFKTLLKNEEILKIKAGAVPIELLPKEKSDIKELKEALSKSVDKQQQMQAIIDLLNVQLNKHDNMIKDLKKTVEELKSSPKVTTLTIQEIKGEFSQKIKQLEENMKTEISSIKNEQQSFLSSSEAQRKMEAFSVQLREIKDQVKKIKDNVMIQRVDIDELKKQVKQSTDNLKRQIADLKTITQNQSLVIDQLQKSLKNQIQENKRIIDDHEERLKRLTDDYQTKIKSIVEGQNQKIKVELKQINDEIKKVDPLVKKFEQQQEQQRKMIESFKWSQQLKSQNMKINGNVLTLVKNKGYREFCLLNASFSNTIKTKQSWAIKINKRTRWIQLGLCLKSKIINYNFNNQNIKLYETGHGLYMIGSDGGCFSHSQKEFNHVNKSFQFGSNDVIYVEYDPIDLKLRFSKNKVEYSELSIIAPQQNDAYHPCVALYDRNSSVELIYPTEINHKQP